MENNLVGLKELSGDEQQNKPAGIRHKNSEFFFQISPHESFRERASSPPWLALRRMAPPSNSQSLIRSRSEHNRSSESSPISQQGFWHWHRIKHGDRSEKFEYVLQQLAGSFNNIHSLTK